MKIALIGNMNNNNFAIMRYFRDLGADAHLLLYKNDGTRTLSHFRPDEDSWEMDKWSAFIHRVDIENGPFSVLGNPERLTFPYQFLCYSKYFVKTLIRRPERRILPPSKTHLRKTFGGYDAYIGSGLTPAILGRIGISLDIFYPYSTGVEFVGAQEFLVQRKRGERLVSNMLDRIALLQSVAIKKSRFVVNSELSLTRHVLSQLGVNVHALAIPMVYNQEIARTENVSPYLFSLMKDLEEYDLSVITHSRLVWSKQGDYSPEEWARESKRNDWLFRGFAQLVNNRPSVKSILFAVEYGPDVEVTKQLCIDLGIQEHVKWLPVIPRRELMVLIGACSVGVGEFVLDHGAIWGGTGWEVLASGKPLLQSFNFAEGEFEASFGHPPPPMLPVQGQDDILNHLIDMADHPEKRKAIGKGAAEWFNRYNGIALAKQWLDLLRRP